MTGMGNSVLKKKRRPLARLFFNMESPILVRRHLYSEQAPVGALPSRAALSVPINGAKDGADELSARSSKLQEPQLNVQQPNSTPYLRRPPHMTNTTLVAQGRPKVKLGLVCSCLAPYHM